MLVNLKSLLAVASVLSIAGFAIATPVAEPDVERHRFHDDSTGSTGSTGSVGSSGGGGGGAAASDPLSSVLSLLGL